MVTVKASLGIMFNTVKNVFASAQNYENPLSNDVSMWRQFDEDMVKIEDAYTQLLEYIC